MTELFFKTNCYIHQKERKKNNILWYEENFLKRANTNRIEKVENDEDDFGGGLQYIRCVQMFNGF